MKKPKIYISGKISGMEEKARELFLDAQKTLEEAGFEAINPMALNHDHDKSWESFMKEDLKALLDCDAVYMLPNWKKSPGAIIEYFLAIQLSMPVYYNLFDAIEIFNHTAFTPRV